MYLEPDLLGQLGSAGLLCSGAAAGAQGQEGREHGGATGLAAEVLGPAREHKVRVCTGRLWQRYLLLGQSSPLLWAVVQRADGPLSFSRHEPNDGYQSCPDWGVEGGRERERGGG